MEKLRDVTAGRIPSWCRRIVKQAGRGINRFSMIEGGDRLLIGISGGKDSLALAFCLSLRRIWLPVSYTLRAAVIDWNEYPIPEEVRRQLAAFFDLLDIKYEFISANMFSSGFEGRFDCYLCSRNRKRILFEKAAEYGITKIALGHHLNDLVETTLINLCLRGNFSTMMPVQRFFGGEMAIIRPLCEVYEKDIVKLTDRLRLPVYETECPYKNTNIRSNIKPVLAQLKKLDKRVMEHIYRAHFNVNRDYGDFSSIRSGGHGEGGESS